MTPGMATRAVYVTGTDTEIGKTRVSVALLHALRAAGTRAVGMKPVASGCDLLAGRWRNADALALQAASTPQPDYADVNPYAFASATSPQLAAADVGARVELATLHGAYARLAAQVDWVVVEGVGGYAASLDAGLDQVDLIRALELPVVLVVGLKLGCQSHARLTARAVQADGLHLLGWIGNHVDREFDRVDDYIQLLQASLPVPCLGIVPHGDVAAAATALELDLLVQALHGPDRAAQSGQPDQAGRSG